MRGCEKIGSSNFLFLNATKIYQFKSKNLDIKGYKPCLGKILKDFTINNMKKKTWLKGTVTYFSVDLIASILMIF